MDIQENFLTRIIRNLLDKGIINVVRDSYRYVLSAGMGGTVGTAISILWELLQGFGGQIVTRLRERGSNNSIFATIRDEILNFIRGLDYMSIIKSLIQRAMEFLQSLAGRAVTLNPYAPKRIDDY
ncbi:uncharacterized protein [Halyomorpha halys]|uniref:uncharacterized protein n=1 Tax=Halyomorpha halys TaxID=286706 RepID=UPI0006D51FB6|nr:uncharacterized protein LOC106690438 [Halyomorpha halys]